MENRLYEFYESRLEIPGFYGSLAKKLKAQPNLHNQFLILPKSADLDFSEDVPCQVCPNDIRFDMPVLIGSTVPDTRILILGLEPRHTNDFYNVVKRENRVYGTPFGIDRWYSSAKQNIYPKAFHPYQSSTRQFLFSDFVKEYLVIDPESKEANSELARARFESLFNLKYRDILEQEIAIFQPHIIIGLGKLDIGKKIPQDFIKRHGIQVVSHPIQGNYPKMKKGLDEIFGIA